MVLIILLTKGFSLGWCKRYARWITGDNYFIRKVIVIERQTERQQHVRALEQFRVQYQRERQHGKSSFLFILFRGGEGSQTPAASCSLISRQEAGKWVVGRIYDPHPQISTHLLGRDHSTLLARDWETASQKDAVSSESGRLLQGLWPKHELDFNISLSHLITLLSQRIVYHPP